MDFAKAGQVLQRKAPGTMVARYNIEMGGTSTALRGRGFQFTWPLKALAMPPILQMPDLNYPIDVRNLAPAPPIRLRPVVDARPSPLWVWLAIFAIGFTLLNLLFLPILVTAVPPGPVPVMPSPSVYYLLFFSLGAVAAEPGLLAIAAVFGPGIAWRRHLAVVFVVLVLAHAGFAGAIWTEWIVSQNLIYGAWMNLPFILVVPIVFCACQLPLWLFRSLLCWRIANEQHGKSKKAPRLSIAGILAATAVIALALGAVRLGPFLFQQIQPLAKVDIHDWWLLVGIWNVGVFAISFAVLPLFTAALFRMKSPLLGTVVAAAWSALLFEAAITITRLVYGVWPLPISWHPLAALVAGFTVSLVVPLLIVRLHGYRLLRGNGS